MSGARLCSVPQCNNVKNINNSFHLFPKDDVLKRKWLKALKMRCATASMKVCSDHFTPENFFFPEYNTVRKKLKKGSIPSRKIPTTTLNKRVANSVVVGARTVRSKKRIQWKEKINFVANNHQSTIREDHVTKTDANKKSHRLALSSHEHDDESDIFSSDDESSSKSSESEIEPIWPYVVKRRIEMRKSVWLDRKVQFTQTTSNIGRTTIVNLLQSESQLIGLTGIGSFELLENIEKSLKRIETMTKQSDKFLLTSRERIILTLAKLKTNMTFACLAALFGISTNTSYEYFCCTISSLRDVMSSLIKWPEKHKIVQNMPRCFENFASTRVIIDCLEVPIDESKSLNSDINNHSHCRKRNVVKYLIGTVTSGRVCLLSPSHDARVSDEQIFIDSRIMERMSEHDTIITNRNFHIEKELEAHGVQLIKPALLLSENLLSPEEALETLELKIHVESVIKQIRIFEILKSSVPRKLLSRLDSIMTVLCGLVNLIPSLSTDEFL